MSEKQQILVLTFLFVALAIGGWLAIELYVNQDDADE